LDTDSWISAGKRPHNMALDLETGKNRWIYKLPSLIAIGKWELARRQTLGYTPFQGND